MLPFMHQLEELFVHVVRFGQLGDSLGVAVVDDCRVSYETAGRERHQYRVDRRVSSRQRELTDMMARIVSREKRV